MNNDQILRRNSVTITGNGDKTIIFAPGLGLSQESWGLVSQYFLQNHRVILFDHMGSGRSDMNFYDEKKYSTLNGFAADLCDLCEVLHLNNAVFVGHSVSSMIGVIASLKRPKSFSKLVFLAPSPHYQHNPDLDDGAFPKEQLDGIVAAMDRSYADWVRNSIPAILNNPDKPEIENSIVRQFLSVDKTIAKQFALATFFSDYRKELLSFATPSLILQCKNDIMSPLQVGDYLHAHLKNNLLEILNAEGHFPHMTHPEQVVRAINKFLIKESHSLVE